MMDCRIINADCLSALRTLPDASVHCCVTSPPYWGLRDYGHDKQIGLEKTPDEYVARMVAVFREVRRVLREDGTLWLNLGDSYAGSGKGGNPPESPHKQQSANSGSLIGQTARDAARTMRAGQDRLAGFKPKDLVGIPWRVAFALQADGWWIRQDIIWHKPNPMPESVRDRCTKAHEYLFLLTTSQRYYYDAEAVSEAAVGTNADGSVSRNRRSVWTIPPKPYKGAHFAVMPPDLVEPCVKAGCPEGGTVLDPFAGSGTTLAVAVANGRSAIGIELNPDYIPLIEQRIAGEQERAGLFLGGCVTKAWNQSQTTGTSHDRTRTVAAGNP